jgi:uncharacterized heparinase superfamily protein
VRRLALYLRSAIRLRPVQLAYLPLRRVQERLPLPPPPTPRVVAAGERLAAAFVAMGADRPRRLMETAEAVVNREFTFLGQTERLAAPDWSRRYVSHLWTFHLHYFDYARPLAWAYRETHDDRYALAFAELATAWIRGTRPGHGDAWSPYVVSIRVVNWVFARTIFGHALSGETRSTIDGSLALQAAWLERRLEKHLQANHLQKNYHALAVAGLFFHGRHARRWRQKGLSGSWRALYRQVLDDGGHFERSPMYHAIALTDYLELLLLCSEAGVDPPLRARNRLTAMLDALGMLSRPDGTLHLFNDAANDAAPSIAHIDRLARLALGRGVGEAEGAWALPATGYFGYASPAHGERMIIDCGPPGPPHQPAHAHCDVLSYELDLHSLPVVVDSGVSGYADDPLRSYQRSTAAHNTVALRGEEQSEIWGCFRVARHARVLEARLEEDAGGFRFTGSYAPYRRNARFQRTVRRLGPGRWQVEDTGRAPNGASVTSRVHLHPDWEVRQGPESIQLRQGELHVRITPFHARSWRVTAGGAHDPGGWYAPVFGGAVPSPVMELDAVVEGGTATFGYTIHALSPERV